MEAEKAKIVKYSADDDSEEAVAAFKSLEDIEK